MALNVIDSHFHIWNPDVQDLPWLADTDGTITNTYTFADLEADYAKIEDINFVGAVYVEVDGADPIQEDMLTYEVLQNEPKLLATLMRSRVEPWMRVPVYAAGIREPLHIPSEPKGRCLEPEFIAGLKEMGKANLVFEFCNRVDELTDVLECVKQVPETTVVINHLGNVGPDSFNDDWKAVMQEFAKLDNLYLKVSGFPTGDKEFNDAVLGFVKETFRADRLLYASNWPVVSLYGTFCQNIAAIRSVFGDDEQLFCENAKRCYHI